MKLKDIIGSMASKFAALALALTCVGNVWGAETRQVSTLAELTDAITAASAGDTIQLTTDITVSGQTITFDKALTLDLNGKTLTLKYASWKQSYLKNTAPLTVVGGTIASSCSLVNDFGIWSESDLTLDGVTITANSTNTSSSTDGNVYAVYQVNGTLTIKDSSLRATAKAIKSGIEKNYAYAVYVANPCEGVSISGSTLSVDTTGRSKTTYDTSCGLYLAADVIPTLSQNTISGIVVANTNTKDMTIGDGNVINGDLHGISHSGTGTVTVDGITVNSGTAADKSYGISNEGTGTIVITGNASITGKFAGACNSKGGTVVIESGTVTATYANTGSGVRNDGPGSVVIDGGAISGQYGVLNSGAGTITVNDGEITGKNAGANSGAVINDSTATGTIDIKGGTVNAAGNAVYSMKGTVAVSGGTVNGTIKKAANGTVTVSGGTFTTDVSSYLAADSTQTDNGNGTYTIVSPVAKLERSGEATQYFTDLHEALEAGKASGSVVTLLADVDLNNEPWTPVGTSSSKFCGVFNGNGHTISNLAVTATTDESGLFGYAQDATISNVVLSAVNVSGANRCAALVGAPHVCVITDVTIEDATVLSTGTYVGGILGNGYATVRNCVVKGTIGGDNTRYQVGGIAGYLCGVVDKCYVEADISGLTWLGGLVGSCQCDSTSAVTDSTFIGTVTGRGTYYGPGVAGLVGVFLGPGTTISGNYSDSVVTSCGTVIDCPVANYNCDDDGTGVKYFGNTDFSCMDGNSWNISTGAADTTTMREYDGNGAILETEPSVVARDADLVFAASDLASVAPGMLRFATGSQLNSESAVAAINAAGNYRAVLNGDGTVTIIAYVAQIGTTKYETLAAAIADAQNGDTVQLLADFSMTAPISTAKDITLDGNGHKITAEGSGSGILFYFTGNSTVKNLEVESKYYKYCIVFEQETEASATTAVVSNCTLKSDGVTLGASAYTTLTVQDSTVTHKGAYVYDKTGSYSGESTWAHSAVAAMSGATINIESGTYDSDTYTAFIFSSGGNFNISGGTFTVTGPSDNENHNTPQVLRADNWAATPPIVADSGFNVSGGTFTGPIEVGSYQTTTYSLLKIADGTFNNYAITKTGTAKVAVSGGKFSSVVDAVDCADGYSPTTTADANGMYTVAADPYAAYVKVADGFYQNGTYYADSTDFYITNLNGLKYFRDLVNGSEVASTNYVSRFGAPSERYETAEAVRSWHTSGPFTGKIVHLMTDIDLGNEEWEPIGYTRNSVPLTISGTAKDITKCYFCGKFDGGIYDSNNELAGTHKVSNLKVTYSGTPASTKSAYAHFCGLFGWWNPPMNSPDYFFKNLTVENVNIQGYNYCGAFFGGTVTTGDYTVDNLHLTGTININGRFSFVGGIAGDARGTMTDCTVEGTGTISGYYNVGGLAGYVGTPGAGITGCEVENVAVAGTLDYQVGALAGFANQVVVSNNTVSAVTVSATSAPSYNTVGILVGASSATGGNNLILVNNTVENASAAVNGSAVTTMLGSTAANAIVGTGVTFDESGKVTGGIFESLPASAIASGYLSVDNLDSETSVNYPLAVDGPYIAVVCDANGAVKQGYKTLAEAIAAANDDETVKMLADTEIESGISVAKDITLDLNGKTIAYTSSEKTYVFTVTDGEMIVTDTAENGKIAASNNGRAFLLNGGSLSVEGGTLSAAGFAIRNDGEGTVAINGGTVTVSGSSAIYNNGIGTVEISGGTVSATGSYTVNNRANGTVVISAGKVTAGNQQAVLNNGMGAVEISGGEISAETYAVNNTASGTVTISGGSVSSSEPAVQILAGALNITGGTITSTAYRAVSIAGGTVNITGGTLVATYYTIHNQDGYVKVGGTAVLRSTMDPYCTIYSGGTAGNNGSLDRFEINGGSIYGNIVFSSTTGTYSISGGIFSVEPKATYIATGYEVVANTDAATKDAYPYTVAGAGYGGEVLPAAPVFEGDTITVTPENIQYTLDGAYGSIDGKTIVLSEGAYPKLYFARATKYPASGTEYYKEQGETRYTTIADIQAHRNEWGTCHYNRTMQNVTLKPADGATVTIAGAECTSGHITGPAYDYLLDYSGESGSMYYLSQTVSNITFDGLTFTGKVNFETSASGDGYGEWHTTIDGVTFDGCTFNGSGTASSVGAAIRYYSEAATGYVSGLTVTDCTFENWYQGVYCNGVKDITVTGSEFDTTGHNAIAVQTQAAANVGTITITDNTFKDIGDRVIRFGNLASGTEITITGNTATNSGDSDGEVIKATGVADGIPVTMSNNSWDSGAKSGSPEFGAAGIGTTYYMSITDAIAAANAQNIDEITILDNTSESPDSAWKVADGKLVRKSYVAQVVGGQSYETIAEAIAAAPDGGTVQVLVDCSIDAHIDVTKNLTLDLNGKTVVNNVNSARAIDLNADGVALTVKANGGGMVIAAGNSYGFFRMQKPNDRIVLDGGFYRGHTDRAALFRYNNSDQSMVLSNVTAEAVGSALMANYISGSAGHYNNLEIVGGSFMTSGANPATVDSEVFRLYGMNGSIKDAVIVCNITSPSGGYNGCMNIQINTGSEFVIEGCAVSNLVAKTASGQNTWASCLTVAYDAHIKVLNCDLYSAQYGVYVFSSGATVELENSNLKADYKALYSQLAVNGSNGDNAVSSGIIKVKSGLVDGTIRADYWDFDTTKYADFFAAGIQIEGGKFKNFVVECPDTPNTIMAISGGVFDHPVMQRFCAENYEPADNTDVLTKDEYPYTVVLKGVAKIGDTYYQTLAAASDAAEAGDTVLLVMNVAEPFVLEKNVSVTLNLNGNTISVDDGNAISATAGELTVTSVVDDKGYATGGVVGAVSVSEGASLNLRGGIYDVDWDECDIEGSIAVSSVNRFYDDYPTEVEAASAVFTSPVPYEYCANGFIPGAYDDIYIDGDYYYYVKEGTYLWKITDADGKVAYLEDVPYVEDDEEYWEYDWFGEHEMNRNGFTMTLLHDVSADDAKFSAYVSGLTYTVDLGGHTVNQQMSFGSGKCYVTITNGVVRNAEETGVGVSVDCGAQVTLGDGLVIAQSTTGVSVAGGTEDGEYSKLTVTDGAVVNGEYGVLVFGSGSENPVTEVVVAGGEINGTLYGISGNGKIEGDEDYSNTRISISGGMVKGGDAGIYHPQAGELSVSGGAITGGMAIYAKSGTISVTGGELSANGASGQYDVSYTEDGPQQTGDAFVVDSANYPGGNPTATISGGTFTSLNGNGVASYAITGQTTVSNFVSGGYFSQYVTDIYCAPGYLCTSAPVANGYYQVVPAAKVTFELGEGAPNGAVAPEKLVYPSGNPAETALPQPTYTSTDMTFAGWKVGGEGDAISTLPAGTTGDITLVATWTGAKSIQIDAGGKELTSIKVTDEWLEANDLADEEDPAVIKVALEKSVNGVPAWESYVLGQSIGAAVSSDAEQGETTLMPVTSTIDVPAADTGFDVQYRLDKVDASGSVVAEGTAQATPDLAVELSDISGSAYYKLTAVVTAKDESGASVTVPADNTIGVLKVESGAKTTAIAVPWEALGGGDISVSNIVRTATLTPGDELKAYDKTTDKYKAWTLSADKTWEPNLTATSDSTTLADGADLYTVKRGSAVWLTRADPSQPIYLVGEVAATEKAEVTLKVGTTDNPSWNLVGSAGTEPVKVNEIGAAQTDKIIVPTATVPKNYEYNTKKGEWGYWDYKTVIKPSGRKTVEKVWKSASVETIPAGTGFWYLNGGESKDINL